jgi:hypothetical protein
MPEGKIVKRIIFYALVRRSTGTGSRPVICSPTELIVNTCIGREQVPMVGINALQVVHSTLHNYVVHVHAIRTTILFYFSRKISFHKH